MLELGRDSEQGSVGPLASASASASASGLWPLACPPQTRRKVQLGGGCLPEARLSHGQSLQCPSAASPPTPPRPLQVVYFLLPSPLSHSLAFPSSFPPLVHSPSPRATARACDCLVCAIPNCARRRRIRHYCFHGLLRLSVPGPATSRLFKRPNPPTTTPPGPSLRRPPPTTIAFAAGRGHRSQKN